MPKVHPKSQISNCDSESIQDLYNLLILTRDTHGAPNYECKSKGLGDILSMLEETLATVALSPQERQQLFRSCINLACQGGAYLKEITTAIFSVIPPSPLTSYYQACLQAPRGSKVFQFMLMLLIRQPISSVHQRIVGIIEKRQSLQLVTQCVEAITTGMGIRYPVVYLVLQALNQAIVDSFVKNYPQINPQLASYLSAIVPALSLKDSSIQFRIVQEQMKLHNCSFCGLNKESKFLLQIGYRDNQYILHLCEQCIKYEPILAPIGITSFWRHEIDPQTKWTSFYHRALIQAMMAKTNISKNSKIQYPQHIAANSLQQSLPSNLSLECLTSVYQTLFTNKITYDVLSLISVSINSVKGHKQKKIIFQTLSTLFGLNKKGNSNKNRLEKWVLLSNQKEIIREKTEVQRVNLMMANIINLLLSKLKESKCLKIVLQILRLTKNCYFAKRIAEALTYLNSLTQIQSIITKFKSVLGTDIAAPYGLQLLKLLLYYFHEVWLQKKIYQKNCYVPFNSNSLCGILAVCIEDQIPSYEQHFSSLDLNSLSKKYRLPDTFLVLTANVAPKLWRQQLLAPSGNNLLIENIRIMLLTNIKSKKPIRQMWELLKNQASKQVGHPDACILLASMVKNQPKLFLENQVVQAAEELISQLEQIIVLQAQPQPQMLELYVNLQTSTGHQCALHSNIQNYYNYALYLLEQCDPKTFNIFKASRIVAHMVINLPLSLSQQWLLKGYGLLLKLYHRLSDPSRVLQESSLITMLKLFQIFHLHSPRLILLSKPVLFQLATMNYKTIAFQLSVQMLRLGKITVLHKQVQLLPIISHTHSLLFSLCGDNRSWRQLGYLLLESGNLSIYQCSQYIFSEMYTVDGLRSVYAVLEHIKAHGQFALLYFNFKTNIKEAAISLWRSSNFTTFREMLTPIYRLLSFGEQQFMAQVLLPKQHKQLRLRPTLLKKIGQLLSSLNLCQDYEFINGLCSIVLSHTFLSVYELREILFSLHRFLVFNRHALKQNYDYLICIRMTLIAMLYLTGGESYQNCMKKIDKLMGQKAVWKLHPLKNITQKQNQILNVSDIQMLYQVIFGEAMLENCFGEEGETTSNSTTICRRPEKYQTKANNVVTKRYKQWSKSLEPVKYYGKSQGVQDSAYTAEGSPAITRKLRSKKRIIYIQ